MDFGVSNTGVLDTGYGMPGTYGASLSESGPWRTVGVSTHRPGGQETRTKGIDNLPFF